MPSGRFYLDADFKEKETCLLEEAEHHHLSHVMKLAAGDTVELINGRGVLASAKIVKIDKRKTFLEILSLEKKDPPTPSLILAAPMMRASKLEWVLEKGCELGADRFLIFKAMHSEKESLSEHQRDRFHSLLIAACKQSGRLYLPSVEILSGLESVFTHQALFLFGDTRDAASKEIKSNDRIVFISGPERGFSEQELQLLDQKALRIKLSLNILRAETAPIAAMSLLGRLRF
jgi:16S rRNA (uracil1498-N3)-methyltransferase